MPNVSKPNPEPAAPSGWDLFTPPVAAMPLVSGAPTIAEWTRTGAPDDSLLLTGDKLSQNTGLNQGEDTQFVVYGQTAGSDSILLEALIQRLDGLKAAITLPVGLPAWSTYLLWPKNSAGCGYPVAVNRTEAWWVGPDQSTHGDIISVYGRNLSHNGGTTASWVYVKPVGAAVGQWARVLRVNPYRVQFIVPSSLSSGTQEVWVHNGHGGSYGWSGPLSLTVIEPYIWDSGPSSIFNVKDYGAKGDGVTDDAAAILAAGSAGETYKSSHPGSHPTVYFPAGIYMMSQGINASSNTRYMGDGMDFTFLKCNANFATSPARSMGLIFLYGRGTPSNIEVRDLTLDTNNVETNDGGRNPWYSYALNVFDVCDNFHLTDVCIKELTGGYVEGCAGFAGTTHLFLTGCTFIGGEVFTHAGSQVAIANCDFINNSKSIRSLGLLGENKYSVTNCTARDDYDPGNPGQGRFISAISSWGTQRNIYVGDNQTSLSPPQINNAGEQVLCEGGHTQYSGHPTTGATMGPGSNTSQVALGGLNLNAANLYINNDTSRPSYTAVIVNGKGLGQHRPITGYDGAQTITVSPAWTVLPDSTSTLIVENVADKWVVYHNDLEGNPYLYDTNYSAMTAMEPFGGCYDWIGDSNTIKYMDRALAIWELKDEVFPNKYIDPCYFNYYTNNAIQSCHGGIGSYCSNGNTILDPEVGFLGTVFRHNTLSNITTVGAFETTGGSGLPLDLTLYEHNAFTNMPEGFTCDASNNGSSVTNSILYKNTFGLGSGPFSGSSGISFGVNTSLPVLRENAWAGFATTYAGAAPGAILEVPVRNFNPAGTTGGSVQAVYTEIWNSGTAPLYWTATSDAGWLTLSSGSGMVADQNSSSPITLTCNPLLLLPGTYTGTVTVTGAAQTKKLIVTLTVSL